MSSRSKVPTPDEIWKDLKEASTIQKASSKKNEEDFAKFKVAQEASSKKNEEDFARIKTIQEETDQMIERIDGLFNEDWGDLVDFLLNGKLVKIFQKQNIDVIQTQGRTTFERKGVNGKMVERYVDIIVTSETELVVVEVRTSLTRKDVDYFLEVLSNFKEFFPRYKNETLYGAMAYLKAESKADILAEEAGLFIIRATGDSACLVNQTNFKPKVFA